MQPDLFAVESNQNINVNIERKPLWISSEIHLNQIEFVSQKFTIKFWLNGFFQHPELTQILKTQKDEIIRGEDVISQHNKHLPFTDNCLQNASEIQHHSPPTLQIHDIHQNVVQLSFAFTATINVRFEIEHFPFDVQFLDIKFVYRKRKFIILSQAPDWINSDQYKLDIPIQVNMQTSITEYQLLEPWLDYRDIKTSLIDENKTFNLKFCLIRLRVRRYPGYHMRYIAFPLWLIVSMLCCVLGLEINDINDRLTFIVTLLLTVVAFQFLTQDKLPESSQVTVIDTMMLFAYGIMCFTMVHIAFIVGHVGDDADDVKEGHKILDKCVIIFVMGLWWMVCLYLVVYKYWKQQGIDWNKISDKKMKKFVLSKQTRFKQAEQIFGTE